jgi:O-antigen/teichoic acid export membrane protein
VLQENREWMGGAYRRAVRVVAFFSFPLVIGLAVTAPEAVRLVYGPQWLPVVPILIWLCVAGVAQPLYETARWLFVSCDRAKEMFRWTCVVAGILAAAYGIGVRWGPLGVAVACGVTFASLVTVPTLYVAHRATGLRLRPTLEPLLPVITATAAMAVGALTAGLVLQRVGAHWMLILLVKVLVGVLSYATISGLFARPLPLEGLERFASRCLNVRRSA